MSVRLELDDKIAVNNKGYVYNLCYLLQLFPGRRIKEEFTSGSHGKTDNATIQFLFIFIPEVGGKYRVLKQIFARLIFSVLSNLSRTLRLDFENALETNFS